MGERSRPSWLRRGEQGGRRVALVDPAPLTAPPDPAVDDPGRRRAARRLKLLAGLLIRGKGGVIDG